MKIQLKEVASQMNLYHSPLKTLFHCCYFNYLTTKCFKDQVMNYLLSFIFTTSSVSLLYLLSLYAATNLVEGKLQI